MFKSLREKFKKMEVNNKIKKLYELTYNPKTIKLCKVATFAFMVIMTKDVYAEEPGTDTTKIGTFANMIKDWSAAIGGIVAGFGGIQAAFGFKNDDPEAKTKGLKTCASGLMVIGVANTLFDKLAKPK
jgi:hypothetical protein